MKIINKPMVKLNFNDYEALQILCSIRNRIENDKVFNCEGINCEDCPFLTGKDCLFGKLSETITAIETKIEKE